MFGSSTSTYRIHMRLALKVMPTQTSTTHRIMKRRLGGS